MMFHVGQKVCVVDDSTGSNGWPVPFSRGDILTISEVDNSLDFNGDNGLLFLELPRPPKLDGHLPSYRASRFRPVVERQTDITVFTAMLTGQPNKVDA